MGSVISRVSGDEDAISEAAQSVKQKIAKHRLRRMVLSEVVQMHVHFTLRTNSLRYRPAPSCDPHILRRTKGELGLTGLPGPPMHHTKRANAKSAEMGHGQQF